MIPAVAWPGSPTRSTPFAKASAFRPRRTPRVRGGAAHGLPVKLHAEQLSNLHGAALAAAFGALSADHLEHLDDAGIAAMAEAGTVAVLLPGAFYFTRETQPAADRRAAPPACRSRSPPTATPAPRRSPRLLLAMNMAATLFRLTVDECIAGMTREAAARSAGRSVGTLEAGKAAISPSGTSSVPPSLSIAWASTRSMPASGRTA
jgi:imidazolonepropionase